MNPRRITNRCNCPPNVKKSALDAAGLAKCLCRRESITHNTYDSHGVERIALVIGQKRAAAIADALRATGAPGGKVEKKEAMAPQA